MDIIIVLIIFLTGFASGFLNSIIGGGALIVIPALIFSGLPPSMAIATNRFGTIGYALSSIYCFHKSKKINYKYVIPFSIISIIGSYIGAKILIEINEDILYKIIGGILIIVIPFTLIKKDFGLIKNKKTKLKIILGLIGYLILSIYDGFFGAAGGIFTMYLVVYAMGFNFIEANATGTIPWLLSAIISTIIFAQHEMIDYYFGIILFISMMLGSYLGARTAIKKGNKFIKILLLIFVIISAIKLIFI